MQNYLVNINDLIVNDQALQFNFLAEMFPVIDELYCKVWFYENLAIMNEDIKQKKIIELKTYISELLKNYSIPEYMLFNNIENNRYIEPISNEEFRINYRVETNLITEEEADKYIKQNKQNLVYKESMNKFKELTKTKYRKR